MWEDEIRTDDEELSEEEALVLFRDQSMTDKDDVLLNIRWVKNDWQNKSKTDTKHTAAFYGVILDLLDRFATAVQKTLLFDAPPGWWSYSFNIDCKGITLLLEHCSSYSCDSDENITPSVIDESFELLQVKSRRLTVEEYAKIYGVEQGTVRQWIRRGKIRTAMKLGNVWRIPELTEPPRRGYVFGQYKWAERLLDLPEEYAFLDKYTHASFFREYSDHTAFTIKFSGPDVEDKVLKCDMKGKEKLELFMISHPLIEFITDQIGCYS